jgi:mannosyltransferase OCH1-like enzyme
MIPKKIHYCWLSGEPFPENIKSCMASWKAIMPDYEWVCWDTSRFDVRSVPFVEEAYQARKWAFAADYIRLHALYTQGGIYLDADVLVKKRFDVFLADRMFSSLEYHAQYVQQHGILALLHPDGTRKDEQAHVPGICLQAAVLGAEHGHPFLEACMNWYREHHFALSPGQYRMHLLAPDIYAQIAVEYGFRYIDEEQYLKEGMHIYPSAMFASTPSNVQVDAFAIHCCSGSWRDKDPLPEKPKGIGKLKQSIVKRFGTLHRWCHSACTC